LSLIAPIQGYSRRTKSLGVVLARLRLRMGPAPSKLMLHINGGPDRLQIPVQSILPTRLCLQTLNIHVYSNASSQPTLSSDAIYVATMPSTFSLSTFSLSSKVRRFWYCPPASLTIQQASKRKSLAGSVNSSTSSFSDAKPMPLRLSSSSVSYPEQTSCSCM
jgi:hypothetical protein